MLLLLLLTSHYHYYFKFRKCGVCTHQILVSARECVLYHIPGSRKILLWMQILAYLHSSRHTFMNQRPVVHQVALSSWFLETFPAPPSFLGPYLYFRSAMSGRLGCTDWRIERVMMSLRTGRERSPCLRHYGGGLTMNLEKNNKTG